MRASEPAHGLERRGRLRQYQAHLLERVRAARAGAAAGSRQLGVLAGASRCLLELGEAGEIVGAGAIRAVPLARDWYLGLANIRGNLTGVVDLARYLGQAPTRIGPDSRIVTFAPGLGLPCGLLVARVLGLRDAGAMTAAARAPAPAPAWASVRLRDAEAQDWLRLELALLAREPRFLQIGF